MCPSTLPHRQFKHLPDRPTQPPALQVTPMCLWHFCLLPSGYQSLLVHSTFCFQITLGRGGTFVQKIYIPHLWQCVTAFSWPSISIIFVPFPTNLQWEHSESMLPLDFDHSANRVNQIIIHSSIITSCFTNYCTPGKCRAPRVSHVNSALHAAWLVTTDQYTMECAWLAEVKKLAPCEMTAPPPINKLKEGVNGQRLSTGNGETESMSYLHSFFFCIAPSTFLKLQFTVQTPNTPSHTHYYIPYPQ